MLSLITGVGAKGQVGEAVAAALARRGDALLLVSRDAVEVRARADELASAGFPASAYGCDLSSAADVERLATQIRAEHGKRLDCLVNLAGGFGVTGPLAESSPDDFQNMFRINLTTAYLTTRAFLRSLIEARGSIVFFASASALEGAQTGKTAAYAAAKSAVIALMRSVSDEGRELVRANALAPASIRTATNEGSMGRDAHYVERADVAAAVAFLCSDASRAITGQVIRLR